ncbi:MAG: MCE family protein [Alphaproteobacteria bacterium]|nr:MCE family protein [Alphaproteobacteria bacterium]
MTNGEVETEAEIPTSEVRRRRGISMVWIVPLVAAAVAGYLLYDYLTNVGPKITITFPDGQNLTETATIRYRGVNVGKVLSISLNENLKGVVVEARLDGSAEGVARTDTKFWIVRPELNISGISGLSTIVTGSYIALEPGSGDKATKFEGLAKAPDAELEKGGREFVLRGDTLRSVEQGTPVLYREVQVGQVGKTSMSDNQSGVDIRILIESEYVPLIRRNTLFWNASGIEASFSLFKTTIDVESISSLIKGGIAFANPVNSTADPAEQGAIFDLLETPPPSYLIRANNDNLHLTLTADTLGAVQQNDRVYYREFPVGHVTHIELSRDAREVEIYLEIEQEYAPLARSNSVFWNASGLHLTAGLFSGAKVDIESLESLIAGGIAFATPDQPGARVTSGSVFVLNPEVKDEWKAWTPNIAIAPPHTELAQNPATVGSSREEMRKVQEALKLDGHYKGEIDGLYGPETRRAITAYQKAVGLDLTGIPDAATLAKLAP